ncbi:cupin domain-containing protein [Fulvivirga sp. RKSG066]|uniref:cupin domain-containing protein n=1 Tax=Fulvivirga aurantia TaxID=2529383 RepID=UPI0012BCCF20|nr:cupin domain-containing protein [Fulvivirga aurantia]MTI22590.1 cupin domain-containing protein [Fulvivirga aurantia]
MDRKEFIKTSGAAVGLAVLPIAAHSQKRKVEPEVTSPKIVRDKEGQILNVIGDIQTHKLLGTDTGNQIVEWVDNVEPGTGIPPHVHTLEDEIFRVIQGEVEIMVDGEVTVLKAGDIAFAPKNVPHAWKVIGTEKVKMATSAFPAGIEAMFTELSQLPEGPPDFAKVAEICGRFGISFV